MVLGTKTTPAVRVEAKVGPRPAFQLELSAAIAVALKLRGGKKPTGLTCDFGRAAFRDYVQ